MGTESPILELPSDTKRRFDKAVHGKLSLEERAKVASEMAEVLKDMEARVEELKAADPFWFYQPSTGRLTPEGHSLMAEFLRPEDIPLQLDGGIHVHASKANIVGTAGGNQSGKTSVGTIHDLIKACRAVPDSLKDIYPKEKIPTKKFNRIRIVCEDYTHGIMNHNLPAMKYWVPKQYLINGKWEESWSEKKQTLTLVHPEEKIVCANIEYMSNQADVETFQGPPLDRVRYDEEPQKKIYDENLLRFVTSERIDIELDETPTNGLSWVFDELFTEEKDKAGNAIEWFKLCSATNPKANLKTLREICRGIKDYNVLKMRLLGEWISLSGLVYGRHFNRRVHVVDPARFGLNPGEYLKCACPHILGNPQSDPMKAQHNPGCRFLSWLVFCGLDPHEVKATAAVFLALDRNGTHVIDTCFREEVTTRELRLLHKRTRWGYRYAFTKCDPHADSDKTALDNRNIFREIRETKDGVQGIPALKKADSYAGSILTGVDVIKLLLEIREGSGSPGLVIMDRPGNQRLINSMRTLQRAERQNEDVKGPYDKVEEGKHDEHAAMRYVLQTRLNWRAFEDQVPVFNLPDQEAMY